MLLLQVKEQCMHVLVRPDVVHHDGQLRLLHECALVLYNGIGWDINFSRVGCKPQNGGPMQLGYILDFDILFYSIGPVFNFDWHPPPFGPSRWEIS